MSPPRAAPSFALAVENADRVNDLLSAAEIVRRISAGSGRQSQTVSAESALHRPGAVVCQPAMAVDTPSNSWPVLAQNGAKPPARLHYPIASAGAQTTEKNVNEDSYFGHFIICLESAPH